MTIKPSKVFLVISVIIAFSIGVVFYLMIFKALAKYIWGG